MWPLHPGLDNQYKLVFTLFFLWDVWMSATQWLRSLIKESIEVAIFGK